MFEKTRKMAQAKINSLKDEDLWSYWLEMLEQLEEILDNFAVMVAGKSEISEPKKWIDKQDVEYLCELSYYIGIKIGETENGSRLRDAMFNASLLCSIDYDYDVFAEFCIYLYDYAISVQAERKESLLDIIYRSIDNTEFFLGLFQGFLDSKANANEKNQS